MYTELEGGRDGEREGKRKDTGGGKEKDKKGKRAQKEAARRKNGIVWEERWKKEEETYLLGHGRASLGP